MATGIDATSTANVVKDPMFQALHEKLYAASTPAFSLGDTTPSTTGRQGLSLADAPTPIVATSARPGQDTTLGPAAPIATDTRPTDTTAVAAPNPADTTVATPKQGDVTTAAPAACSTFNYGDNGSAADDPKITNWRPNPNSKSQLTQSWFAEHSRLSSVAPEDGPYTVKFGDCLESIARRELKKEGKATDSASIEAEKQKIIDLNKDHYKSLTTNSEFIKDGWKLKLTDCNSATPPPTPAPTDTTQASPQKKDSPDVIITDKGGDIYYNEQKVGSHDRVKITNGVATEEPIPDRRQPGQADTTAVTPAVVPGDSTTKVVAATPPGDSTAPVLTPTQASATPDATAKDGAATSFPVLDSTAPVVAAAPDSTVAAKPSTDALTPGPAGSADVPKIVNVIATKPKETTPTPNPAKQDDSQGVDPSSLGPA
ncbi:MAG TPA: hypothetical protein V6C86_08835 [Oculatellaceae cyanobacterium]